MIREGYISAIHGDVVEVEFSEELPPINDALIVGRPGDTNLILEVSDHANPNTVKSIALGFTQGLKRGMAVNHAEGPLRIPVGRNWIGRVINIFGLSIDGKPVPTETLPLPIHKLPPPIEDQLPASGILEKEIKIIDLLSPFQKGSKVGLFGGARMAKTILLMEFIDKTAKLYSGIFATGR
jgi:F-type H+-transporting ATPase subunit beta